MDALKKHLSKQLQTYGPMKLVNLVNQKGHEKPIKDAYERAMAEVQVFFHIHNYGDIADTAPRLK